jgi:S1-C subfamily serine protease
MTTSKSRAEPQAPFFALEGIISRFAVVQQPDGSQCTYIQTFSPGLCGQSGGPFFDSAGRLCGLQSSATHLDLGFDAMYERDGRQKVERQFLNVGQAVHVDEIVEFPKSQGVSYASEPA